MSKIKKYGIPVVQALMLTGTTACTDPMYGSWEGTSYTYDGDRYSLPYLYENGGYEVRFQINLTFDDNDKGELEIVSTYGYSGALNTQQNVYDIEGTRTSKGVWDMEINDLNDLDLTCTAVKDELECDGEDISGIRTEIKFERE